MSVVVNAQARPVSTPVGAAVILRANQSGPGGFMRIFTMKFLCRLNGVSF